MRNNLERLGLDSKSPQDDNIAGTSQLNFVVPTEIVDLPSRGLFYPEQHPLHGKDTIEIRYMTAKDEDTLTNQSLLKKGLALEKVLQDIIIDKRVTPDSLLIGDKNAIIIAVLWRPLVDDRLAGLARGDLQAGVHGISQA